MKCSETKHEFEGKNVKCICGKANIWWMTCKICKVPNTAKIRGIPCEDCLKDPAYLKELKKSTDNQPKTRNKIKHYREATAFGYDKETGQPIALDKRGRRFDPSETRYNLEKDPHGWGATDKIPKKKRYYI